MHVAEDDRRLHAAAAVALNPAVGREGATVQELGEVFDHVAALEFAVHQDIDAGLLLALDDSVDARLDESLVIVPGKRPQPEFSPRRAQLAGLGKGARRRGRKKRQTKDFALLGHTHGKGAGALQILGGNALQALPELRMVNFRMLPPGLVSLPVFRDPRAVEAALGQPGHLGRLCQLLHGEGQHLLEFRLQPGLAGDGEGGVEQRTGGGHHQPIGPQPLLRLVDDGQGVRVVVFPDVAAVDHPEGQGRAGRDRGQEGIEVFCAAHQVNVITGGRQLPHQIQVVAQGAEIAGGHQADAGNGPMELPIGLEVGLLLPFGQVHDQAGLVHLHPIRPEPGQGIEEFAVGRQ